MPRTGRAVITVPAELWKQVRALPLARMGYSSPTEFVKEAVRKLLRETTTLGGRSR